MKTLNSYLTFGGNCREAMEFYKACLNAETLTLQTFAEANMPTPEAFKDRILHAELKTEGIHIMASDGMADFSANFGNTISLSILLNDAAEQERIFNALAAGGTITMPLQKTFWGAIYGMLTDRFGIQWMLNCSL